MASTRPTTKLNNNPFAAPTFIYPSDLGSPGQEPYIIFDIRDGVSKAVQSKGTIAMYMPASLKVGYKNNYEEGSTTILEYVKKSMGEGGDITDKAGTALERWAYEQAIRQGTPIEQLTHHKRQLVNPHMAVLYKGVSFRIFHFEFHLMPRNPQESESIKNIIYSFKYAAHPNAGEPDALGNFKTPASSGSGAANSYLFQYPDNFIIGLFSPADDYLFRISTCVLESMDVDYAGSGIPSFFDYTGAPVDIRLTLDFKETEVMTKQRIEEGY